MAAPDEPLDPALGMLRHLTAPLAAGARRTPLALSSAGALQVPASRRPLLLATLLRSLDGQELAIQLALAGQPAPDPVRFAAFTPAGAALPLWRGGEGAAALAGTLAARLDEGPIAAAALADWLRIELVEGNLGRLLITLGDEKARLHREMARLATMRARDKAAADALDRIGNDLGIRRLESQLQWNAPKQEITLRAEREGDAAYRARLAPALPWLAPTPAAVRSLLAGVDERLSIAESKQRLAAAVRIIGAGDDASDPLRARLLAQMRTDRLLFLNDDGEGSAIHAARPLTAARRQHEAALRRRLQAAFRAAPDAAVAPRLGEALDRAARLLLALGASPIEIVRAQDGAGGSRYDCGMGVLIKLPTAAAANALRQALLQAATGAPADDADTQRLIEEAAALAPAAGDRSLSWLWQVAGFATLHQTAADSLYLSHLPTAGLVIDVERPAGAPSPTLRARFNAPGDPGHSAALALAAGRFSGPGLAPVAPGAVAAALAAVTVANEGNPLHNGLVAAGLPPARNSLASAAALSTIADDLWLLFEVDPALASALWAGAPAASASLAQDVAALRTAGFASALPLPATGNRLYVAAAVVSLPSAGVNLGERVATGVRWLLVPLAGKPTLFGASGFANRISLPAGSLAAVVALASLRDGTPDPYELEVTLPDGALLDLATYERLMNVLERCFPVGVGINTWALRQRHVDLDGDGTADPLPPRLARHYRSFRLPFRRGLAQADDDASFPSENG